MSDGSAKRGKFFDGLNNFLEVDMCVVIGWYGNNPPSSKEVAGSKDIFDTAFDCASKVVETAKPFVKEVVMAAAADVVVEIGKRAIEDATGIDLGSSRRKS